MMVDDETVTNRIGPRPLPFHLTMAMGQGLGALGTLPLAMSGMPPWPATSSEDQSLTADLAAADTTKLMAEISAASNERLEVFIRGLQAYWAHPHRRVGNTPGEQFWRIGSTTLTDHGPDSDAPAVLLVPSLVNRAYILDLAPDCSLVKYLVSRGIRPFLLDWQSPGPEEQAFTLTDYVRKRLVPAYQAARKRTGRPIIVLGYCMGGLLALALAQQTDVDAAGLALLATPWDFHADDAATARTLGQTGIALEPLMGVWAGLPVDVLQLFFASLNPTGVVDKFRRFSTLKQDGQAARMFVQIEDWANDGVPLAKLAALECFRDWYRDNKPGNNQWEVAGKPICPEQWDRPTWMALPRNDRIVPPGSATALANQLPHAEVHSPQAGHIGLVVGSGARKTVWSPLSEWILQLG